MLNLTRLHLGTAHESQFQGLGISERDWSRSAPRLTYTSQRALEWYFECNLMGYRVLHDVVQIDPRRAGGVPVLMGTRFTVAQTLAELAQTGGVQEVADNYDLDPRTIREMLTGLSLILMRPFAK